jgi:hypothetical protein
MLRVTRHSPRPPTEYSTYDIRDRISSPTPPNQAPAIFRNGFSPVRKKTRIFFRDQPHSQIKNALFAPLIWNKALYNRGSVFPRPPHASPQQNYLETPCPPDLEFFLSTERTHADDLAFPTRLPLLPSSAFSSSVPLRLSVHSSSPRL